MQVEDIKVNACYEYVGINRAISGEHGIAIGFFMRDNTQMVGFVVTYASIDKWEMHYVNASDLVEVEYECVCDSCNSITLADLVRERISNSSLCALFSLIPERAEAI